MVLLVLGEKILLTCTKNKKNKLRWLAGRRLVGWLLGASILKDLEILGNLVVKGKRDLFLKVEIDIEKPIENIFLQEILYNLPYAKRIISKRKLYLSSLIESFGKKKWNIENKLWKELENKGIIQNQKREHILIKPEARDEIISTLHNCLIQKSEPDIKTRALLGFLDYSGGWSLSFRKSEWDKKWVKQIISDDKISKKFYDVMWSHASGGPGPLF